MNEKKLRNLRRVGVIFPEDLSFSLSFFFAREIRTAWQKQKKGINQAGSEK